MKSLFPGYYSPTVEDINKIRDEGIFVFDANVLLNFYRFSQNTTDELFKIMQKLWNRIRVPYQACLEYHTHLHQEILKQSDMYKKARKQLQDFWNLIESKRDHPFLDEEASNEIKEFCARYEEVLAKRQEEEENTNTHPIKETLAEFLEGKVGEPLSPEEESSLLKKGEARYSKKIPPGYCDKGPNKFGDLIVWEQILKKNASIDKPMLFVTDDNKKVSKDDWFEKALWRTIWPRAELLKEFQERKGNLFYAYNMDQFLTYAADRKLISEEAKNQMLEELWNLSDTKEEGNTSNDSSLVDNSLQTSLDTSTWQSGSLTANSAETSI